jgi:hypothetical protein
MDLTSLVVALLVFALVGFICYLIVTYIPMPAPFPQVIVVVIVILMVLYLLGLITGHTSVGGLHLRN